jgi:sortase A
MTRTVKIILCALAVLIAAGVTLYPLLSNRYAEKTKSLIETQYTEAIQQLDESELIAAREAAHEYNTTLVNVTDKAFSKEALIRASESYDTLLNIRGDGLMGYVEIPKISVNLPIYHGAGDDSLNRGVGHQLGSALPVGGEATHCILTGHSGLAKDKLFSDLDKLEVGDMFFIHVLNDTLAYRVKELFTVLPEDTSRLLIEGQHDYCTLITCTPLGVNTHRLLVRGERVKYAAPEELVEMTASQIPDTPAGSTWLNAYLRGVFLALLVIVTHVIVVLTMRGLILFRLGRACRRPSGRKRGRHEV